jgi:hypothetical protein
MSLQHQQLVDKHTEVGARVYLTDDRQLERADEWHEADFICINYPELKQLYQENRNINELIRPSQDLVVTLTADSDVVDEEPMLQLSQTIAEVAPVTLITDLAYAHGGDPDYLIDCHVGAYLEHLKKLIEIIDRLDEPISVVPLVKALSEDHYEKTKRTFRELGFSTAAFYISQFFLGISGNPTNKIKSYISRSITKLDIQSALIIGLGAPQILADLPPRAHMTCYFHQWFDNKGNNEEQFAERRRALRSVADRQTRLTNPAAWRTGEGD